MSQQEQLLNTIQMVEQDRRQVLDWRQRQSEISVTCPEHIRLSMITPFADGYKLLIVSGSPDI